MTSLAFQTSWTCSVGQLPFVRNTETSVLTTIVSASNLLTKTFCSVYEKIHSVITVRAVIVKVITLYEWMLDDRFILMQIKNKRESNNGMCLYNAFTEKFRNRIAWKQDVGKILHVIFLWFFAEIIETDISLHVFVYTIRNDTKFKKYYLF